MTTIVPLKTTKTAPTGIATAELSSKDISKALSSNNKADILNGLELIARAGEGPAKMYGYADLVGKVFYSDSPDLVCAAVKAAGCMGSAAYKLIPTIQMGLKHDKIAVRAESCVTLAKFGTNAKTCSKSLQDCAQKGDTMVRVLAIQALGLVGASDNAQFLTGLLGESNPDVKGAVVEALGALGEGAVVPAKEYEALLSNPRTAPGALKALASLGAEAPASCSGKVTDCLKGPDIVTIDLAVTALLAGVPGNASAMKDMLNNQTPSVKAAAAMGLGALGADGSQYSSAVADLLEDGGEDDSSNALVMGGGGKRAPAYLRKPKCAALISLGRLGAEDQLNKISMALTDEDFEVRGAALDTILLMKEFAVNFTPDVAELLMDPTYTVRGKACAALGSLKASDEVDSLAPLLKDSASSVRLAALTALGDIGEASEKYCHEVFKLVSDQSPAIRATALKTLSLMGDIGCNYASMVAVSLNDLDASVRCEALEALGRMGEFGAAFSEELFLCQDDADADVRASAGKALMTLGLVSPFKREEEQAVPKPQAAPVIIKPTKQKLKFGAELTAQSTATERALSFLNQFCADIEAERENRGITQESKPAFLPF